MSHTARRPPASSAPGHHRRHTGASVPGVVGPSARWPVPMTGLTGPCHRSAAQMTDMTALTGWWPPCLEGPLPLRGLVRGTRGCQGTHERLDKPVTRVASVMGVGLCSHRWCQRCHGLGCASDEERHCGIAGDAQAQAMEAGTVQHTASADRHGDVSSRRAFVADHSKRTSWRCNASSTRSQHQRTPSAGGHAGAAPFHGGRNMGAGHRLDPVVSGSVTSRGRRGRACRRGDRHGCPCGRGSRRCCRLIRADKGPPSSEIIGVTHHDALHQGEPTVQCHAGADHSRVGSIKYFWPVARLLYWVISSGSSAPASDTTLV